MDPSAPPPVPAVDYDALIWDTMTRILRAAKTPPEQAGTQTPIIIGHPEARTAEMPAAGQPPEAKPDGGGE